MTPGEVLASLFGETHGLAREGALLWGEATLPGGCQVAVTGLTDGAQLGVDDALVLAGRVLEVVERGGGRPILMLLDSGSQRMSRRDELMGLSEALAHLAKSLLFAARAGHPTVGLLIGGSAAGAFLATGLATRTLLAMPVAHPEVMDLPSMARVTKLPLDTLKQMAVRTPVFAPGLGNFVQTGAVARVLDPARPLGPQLVEALAGEDGPDRRDEGGAARGGRTLAASVARRVQDLQRDG